MLHLCGYEGCYERFQTIKRLREHRRRQGHVAAPRRASGRVRGSLKRYVPLAAMNKKGKWEEKDLRQRGEDSHVDFVSKPWRTGGPRGAGTPRPKEEEHSNAGAGVGARATAAAGKRLLGAALGAATEAGWRRSCGLGCAGRAQGALWSGDSPQTTPKTCSVPPNCPPVVSRDLFGFGHRHCPNPTQRLIQRAGLAALMRAGGVRERPWGIFRGR